jgi:hypothetical protein
MISIEHIGPVIRVRRSPSNGTGGRTKVYYLPGGLREGGLHASLWLPQTATIRARPLKDKEKLASRPLLMQSEKARKLQASRPWLRPEGECH